MRAPGPSSWTISARDGSPFTTALYVREAFGLGVAPDIPRLTPPVPFLEELAADPVDWDAWWDAICAAGPEIAFVAPPTGPDLFLAYEQVLRNVSVWANRERRHPDPRSPDALDPTRMVRALEQSLGRRASFSFFVDALPVTGDWHRDVSPTWVLVSTDVWLDARRLIPLLEERVRPLI
ncbi:hypothetical protein [Cellulomonas sp. URHD0024]|uniref:hypothetical protein n=1 Tax=Cellulomonas sp. URHD0024 TaxID=1302620 RepID=UPI00040371ED|nr:hypothetical protein [Cellulomonas sp. URHD0024]